MYFTTIKILGKQNKNPRASDSKRGAVSHILRQRPLQRSRHKPPLPRLLVLNCRICRTHLHWNPCFFQIVLLIGISPEELVFPESEEFLERGQKLCLMEIAQVRKCNNYDSPASISTPSVPDTLSVLLHTLAPYNPNISPHELFSSCRTEDK